MRSSLGSAHALSNITLKTQIRDKNLHKNLHLKVKKLMKLFENVLFCVAAEE